MVRRLLAITLVTGLAACEVPPPYSPVVAAPVPVAAPVFAPAPGPTVGERLARDQQRINDGLRLGQFTPAEYNELQGRHNAIEGTRRAELAQNGGQFAPGQYPQLLAREDALSRTIFAYRHNGATPTAH